MVSHYDFLDFLRKIKNADLHFIRPVGCLLYTSDAADEGLGVDLGGRRIIKKKAKMWRLAISPNRSEIGQI